MSFDLGSIPFRLVHYKHLFLIPNEHLYADETHIIYVSKREQK